MVELEVAKALKSIFTLAVDTFSLVLADNDVTESSAAVEQEDCVGSSLEVGNERKYGCRAKNGVLLRSGQSRRQSHGHTSSIDRQRPCQQRPMKQSAKDNQTEAKETYLDDFLVGDGTSVGWQTLVVGLSRTVSPKHETERESTHVAGSRRADQRGNESETSKLHCVCVIDQLFE